MPQPASQADPAKPPRPWLLMAEDTTLAGQSPPTDHRVSARHASLFFAVLPPVDIYPGAVFAIPSQRPMAFGKSTSTQWTEARLLGRTKQSTPRFEPWTF